MERPVPDSILLRTPTQKTIVPHATLPARQACIDALQDELSQARSRIGELEDALSVLLAKGALPRYSLFLPPYFIARHQGVISAMEMYGELYREAVRRRLLPAE